MCREISETGGAATGAERPAMARGVCLRLLNNRRPATVTVRPPAWRAPPWRPGCGPRGTWTARPTWDVDREFSGTPAEHRACQWIERPPWDGERRFSRTTDMFVRWQSIARIGGPSDPRGTWPERPLGTRSCRWTARPPWDAVVSVDRASPVGRGPRVPRGTWTAYPAAAHRARRWNERFRGGLMVPRHEGHVLAWADSSSVGVDRASPCGT